MRILLEILNTYPKKIKTKMNYSYEELYSMCSQYDTLINIVFYRGTFSFKNYGATLTGNIKYTLEERKELDIRLKQTVIPRTEREIKFTPSELEKLTSEQVKHLDKNGFLCSDIFEIHSVNLPRTNRFIEKEKKDIPNTLNIKINTKDWQDLNRINFGFLNLRFERNDSLSPNELYQYLGLREYYKIGNLESPYKELKFQDNGKILKPEVKYYELKAKFDDLVITKDEMKVFEELLILRFNYREKLINKELQKSTERLNSLANIYGDEIKNLKSICHSFEERVILFGEKLIYLNFERFLHIYARHVTETQVGEKFAGKTVFQYKSDDIVRLISLVMDVTEDDIQQHFIESPDTNYRRMGQRSVYFDGHYYRVEIDTNGKLLTFHPYNNNEEKKADSEK